MRLQKITPFLWFDYQAEEAAHFYLSVFKNSRIKRVTHYLPNSPGPEGTKMPEGSVMTVEFEIEGMDFVALNGGPLFKFTEAISFYIKCETQEEIDYYWERLSDGGEIQQCGWVLDKYGLAWQVSPPMLDDMLADDDKVKAGSVMQAMLKMKKIDINTLLDAYNKA